MLAFFKPASTMVLVGSVRTLGGNPATNWYSPSTGAACITKLWMSETVWVKFTFSEVRSPLWNLIWMFVVG